MIQVTRKEDGSYATVHGHMRLRAELQLRGRAEVVDLCTGKRLVVHDVGGQMLALTEDAEKTLSDAARRAKL